jgi:hypothetical protein
VGLGWCNEEWPLGGGGGENIRWLLGCGLFLLSR